MLAISSASVIVLRKNCNNFWRPTWGFYLRFKFSIYFNFFLFDNLIIVNIFRIIFGWPLDHICCLDFFFVVARTLNLLIFFFLNIR